jgi:RNA polymerase-binding transcription factor DksA
MSSLLSPSDLLQYEQRLRDRSRVLRKEIRETLLRANAERYADIAERVQDSQDQSLAVLLADVAHADVARDAREIQDIDGALLRLAAATYGECVQCGARIPRARLDAYPTAKRCLPCQQVHERSRAARPAASA